MSEFVYIPVADAEMGEVAAYLLALADEKGIDRKQIQTALRGFNVPAGLVEDGEFTPPAPVAGKGDVTKDAPAWFTEPAREVDIELGEDGAIYVKDEYAAELAAELGTTVEAINDGFDGETSKFGDLEVPGGKGAEDQGEPDREDVREWAKANGYEPAEKGALKKAVITAYNEAHA